MGQTKKAEAEANIDSLVIELRRTLQETLGDESLKPHLTDNFLKRWIRAMKYNVRHAARAIVKNSKWRMENRIDGILEEDFSDVFCPVTYRVIAHDFQRRPVILVEPTDELFNYEDKELRKMVKEKLKSDRIRLERFAMFHAETLETIVRNSPNPFGNAVVIFDGKGHEIEVTKNLKFAKKLLPLLSQFKEVAEEHYPRLVHSVYVINGQKKILRVVLGLVSTSMSGTQKDRLHIFGRKKEKWSKALLEIIPASDLSRDLGGTKS